ncbi:Rox3 mediator complex subunit-domain-containing protein [Amylocarpus encephaloides]|uniref:Mediator of RNA polymerase II transcription subunit 19 n=1 Tax=Amylocarpus encephaloides TaxID=45428 RepID=A0A9P7Y950_9HELO|nr:Rox3 mediator complex subunit-domain-containing protein [Amylocarpus encephaloides]
MPSDHPQTPESPSQVSAGASDLHRKPSTSPHFTNSLPTPAHSINGSMSSLGSDPTASGFSQDESSHKRKRDIDDSGDRNQKKLHIEDKMLSIKDLHLDVGEKYLLCKTPHPRRHPNLTEDLHDRFFLNDVAQSVARTKPDGSKNALRKSYKKYIKDLGLGGAFDVGKKEEGAPDSLYGLLLQPDEEWEAQHVRGQEIEMGLPNHVQSIMGPAFRMARGKIPKNLWDSSVLGEVAQAPKAMSNGAKTPLPQNAALARAAKGEIPRPKRNVKKRSYGDSNFESYGEGFVNVENQDAGYSTGEGDDRGGRKRPKKTGAPHNFQGPIRQGSYGPGMVGV